MGRLATWLIVLVGGCASFSPELPPGVGCGTEGECPAGLRCEPVIATCVDEALVAIAGIVVDDWPAEVDVLAPAPAVVARLVDDQGRVLPISGGTFVVSLEPGHPPLVDAPTGRADAGVIRVEGLQLVTPGRGLRLRVSAGSLAGVSRPFDVRPSPAKVHSLAAGEVLASCATVSFSVSQAQSLPVEVLVELDPDGAGPEPYRPATQAASPVGQAGVGPRSTTPMPRAQSFSWDTSVDVPARALSGSLRITPVAQGWPGTPAVVPVRIDNGVRLVEEPLPENRRKSVSQLVIADVDLDGWADEITTRGAVVSVAMGNSQTIIDLSLPSTVRDVATADVDDDGRPDLVVATQASGLQLLRQTQRRSFAAPAGLPGPGRVEHVVVGDAEGDGDDDLVVIAGGGGDVLAYRQDRSEPSGFHPPLELVAAAGAEARLALFRWFGGTDLMLVVARPSGPVLALDEPFGSRPQVVELYDLAASAVAVGELNDELGGDAVFLGASALASVGVHLEVADAREVVVGDLDGDGASDLLVATAEALRLYPRVRRPGSVEFGEPVVLAEMVGAHSLQVVDRDRDGRLDVLALDEAGHPRWWRNQQARRCHPRLAGPIRTGDSGPGDLQVADVELDGKPDLLKFDRGLWVARGLGDGSFSPFEPGGPEEGDVSVGRGASGVRAADLDGDGLVEVLYMVLGSPTLTILRNDMAHPGVLSVELLPTGSPPRAFDLGDLDGDGVVDLVIFVEDGVVVRRGETSRPGQFRASEPLPGSPLPMPAACSPGVCGVELVDLSGDGRPEIVIAMTDSLSVYAQDGAGGFLRAAELDRLGLVLHDSGNLAGDDRGEVLVEVLGPSASQHQLVAYALGPDGLDEVWSAHFSQSFTLGRALVTDLELDGSEEILVGFDRTCVVAPRAVAPGSTLPMDRCVELFVEAAADVDGDRRVDLIGSQAEQRSVLTTARSDGTLDRGERIAGPARSATVGLVSRDVFPDLIAVDEDNQGTLIAFQSSFLPGTSERIVHGPGGEFVRVADLDGDLRADLVTASDEGLFFVISEQDQAEARCADQRAAPPVAIADVDDDGAHDLVYPDGDRLLRITSPGRQCAPAELVGTYGESYLLGGVALVDLNLDGRLDLVTRFDAASALQTSEGVFAELSDIDPGANIAVFDLRDFDRDGFPDALALGFGGDGAVVTLYLGLGDGRFAPGRVLVSDARVSFPYLVDLDADGWLDVYTGHEAYLQRPDGSGAVTRAVTGIPGGETIEVLDFDLDGKVDVLAKSLADTVLFRGR